jgi:hypothetical protein
MEPTNETPRTCYLCGGAVHPLAQTNVCDDHDSR